MAGPLATSVVPPLQVWPWTQQEDHILLEHVRVNGTRKWKELVESGKLPRRNTKACCNRYRRLKIQAQTAGAENADDHPAPSEARSTSYQHSHTLPNSARAPAPAHAPAPAAAAPGPLALPNSASGPAPAPAAAAPRPSALGAGHGPSNAAPTSWHQSNSLPNSVPPLAAASPGPSAPGAGLRPSDGAPQSSPHHHNTDTVRQPSSADSVLASLDTDTLLQLLRSLQDAGQLLSGDGAAMAGGVEVQGQGAVPQPPEGAHVLPSFCAGDEASCVGGGSHGSEPDVSHSSVEAHQLAETPSQAEQRGTPHSSSRDARLAEMDVEEWLVSESALDLAALGAPREPGSCFGPMRPREQRLCKNPGVLQEPQGSGRQVKPQEVPGPHRSFATPVQVPNQPSTAGTQALAPSACLSVEPLQHPPVEEGARKLEAEEGGVLGLASEPGIKAEGEEEPWGGVMPSTVQGEILRSLVAAAELLCASVEPQLVGPVTAHEDLQDRGEECYRRALLSPGRGVDPAEQEGSRNLLQHEESVLQCLAEKCSPDSVRQLQELLALVQSGCQEQCGDDVSAPADVSLQGWSMMRASTVQGDRQLLVGTTSAGMGETVLESMEPELAQARTAPSRFQVQPPAVPGAFPQSKAEGQSLYDTWQIDDFPEESTGAESEPLSTAEVHWRGSGVNSAGVPNTAHFPAAANGATVAGCSHRLTTPGLTTLGLNVQGPAGGVWIPRTRTRGGSWGGSSSTFSDMPTGSMFSDGGNSDAPTAATPPPAPAGTTEWPQWPLVPAEAGAPGATRLSRAISQISANLQRQRLRQASLDSADSVLSQGVCPVVDSSEDLMRLGSKGGADLVLARCGGNGGPLMPGCSQPQPFSPMSPQQETLSPSVFSPASPLLGPFSPALGKDPSAGPPRSGSFPRSASTSAAQGEHDEPGLCSTRSLVLQHLVRPHGQSATASSSPQASPSLMPFRSSTAPRGEDSACTVLYPALAVDDFQCTIFDGPTAGDGDIRFANSQQFVGSLGSPSKALSRRLETYLTPPSRGLGSRGKSPKAARVVLQKTSSLGGQSLDGLDGESPCAEFAAFSGVSRDPKFGGAQEVGFRGKFKEQDSDLCRVLSCAPDFLITSADNEGYAADEGFPGSSSFKGSQAPTGRKRSAPRDQ